MACRARRIRAAAGALAIVLLAAPAFGQRAALTGTVQFARGTYFFTEPTDSVFVVAGLDVAAGPVRVSVSLPLSWQSQPWLVPGAHVIIPSGGAQYAAVGRSLQGRGKGGAHGDPAPVVLAPTETTGWTSGIGDPLGRVDVTVVRGTARRPTVSLAGGFKAPLADVASGLGTGEWDYGGGLSIAQPVARILALVDVFYWRLGDLPDLVLEDTVSYSLGVGTLLHGGRLSVIGSLSGSTQILEGTAAARSAGLALSFLASANRSLTVGVTAGLTETAPDYTVWLGWRIAM